MRISTRLMLLVFSALSLALLALPVEANSVPTHGRSSYGSDPSTIISSFPSTSIGGTSVQGESFCSFSDSFGDECALSFAYQFTSGAPAGATSLTITLPVPAGSSLLSPSSPFSFGILTNDSPGGNIFFSPLTEAQVAALPDGAITFGLDGSGNPTMTIFDLSLVDNLAIFMDLSDNADPFGTPSSPDSHFCEDATNTTCTYDIPSLTTPEISATFATAPEPGTLVSLVSGLGLLGLFRRRSYR